MSDEFDALIETHTWDLVDLPPEDCSCMQVGLQNQDSSKWICWTIQSSFCGEGFHSRIWYWLRWDLCSSCSNCFCQNFDCSCCNLSLAVIPDTCQNAFQWWSDKGSLQESSSWMSILLREYVISDVLFMVWSKPLVPGSPSSALLSQQGLRLVLMILH